MSRVKTDIFTTDLFEVPRAAISSPGSLACRQEIAAVMSDAIRNNTASDRYQIAAEMSRLLGRDFSKNMLDAYTAESREDHMPPIDTAIAFDMAVGGFSLINIYAAKLGCKVMVGSEVLLHELGRIEQEEANLAKRKKALKKYLGDK